MPDRVRILSDLHYLDADSRLQKLEQLLPLLDGVDHLVLNGDSLDTQRTPHGDAKADFLRQFLAKHVNRITLITGNHDPVISDCHDLLLGGGKVWVFHGDVMFEGIAPWSAMGRQLRESVRAARIERGVSPSSSFEELVRVHRSVCRAIHMEFDVTRRDPVYRVWRLFRSVFPPNQLWMMLHVWRSMPAETLAYADRHRPGARFVITGHCHAASVFSKNGRVALNTGSFCRPRGAFCVDVEGSTVEVRQIQGDTGEPFRTGPVRHCFPLA